MVSLSLNALDRQSERVEGEGGKKRSQKRPCVREEGKKRKGKKKGMYNATQRKTQAYDDKRTNVSGTSISYPFPKTKLTFINLATDTTHDSHTHAKLREKKKGGQKQNKTKQKL
jgi:hypothetical protein